MFRIIGVEGDKSIKFNDLLIFHLVFYVFISYFCSINNSFMKRFIFTLLIIFLAYSAADAQRWKLLRYRLHFGVSSANYFGDIGGAMTESNLLGVKDIDLNQIGLNFHVGGVYKITESIDVKANFNFGRISGSDYHSKNENRGLSFKSTVIEPSLQVNYYYYSSGQRSTGNIFSSRGMLNNYSKTNLYLFAGLGGAFYSPKIEEDLVQERRLNMENKPESVNEFNLSTGSTLVVPLGLGAVYNVSSSWEVGLEIGARLTLTDYFDGFSSYYSDGVNDIYYLTTFSAIYRIKTKRNGWPRFDFF